MNVPQALSTLVFLSLAAQGPAADAPTPDAVLANVAAKRAAYDTAKKAKDDAEQAARDYKVDLDKKFADAGLVGPAPVPPNPADPLTLALKQAYQADPSKTKAEDLLTLEEVMKQVQGYCGDKSLLTVSAIGAKAAGAMNSLMGNKDASGNIISKRLQGVIDVLNAAVKAQFGGDAPLTDELRASMKALFVTLQSALSEAGK